MNRTLALTLPIIALAACKPPPTDDAEARGALAVEQKGPSMPIDSPDSENAIWADSVTPNRIIYGNPGEAPMLALSCEEETGADANLRITRYALADEGAGAFMALVGNSHIARIPVDATPSGTAFIWSGVVAANHPDLEVLTGQKAVTATTPGAGMVTLNPSGKPRELIENCRGDDATKAVSEDAELVR